MADTTHLFSTVKNPTANTRTYGYLGRHSRVLAAGAHYTEEGDITTKLWLRKKRYIDAYKRDLLSGAIQLDSTPRPIYTDAVLNSVKAEQLSSGTLGVIDPSWGAYSF